MKRRFSLLNYMMFFGGADIVCVERQCSVTGILVERVAPADQGTSSDPLQGIAKRRATTPNSSSKPGRARLCERTLPAFENFEIVGALLPLTIAVYLALKSARAIVRLHRGTPTLRSILMIVCD
ncbi:hypothetical protein HFO39_32160 [Rhizobium leguminosarum]|uniref:hypothetical protein n=1 Tax=Rhizobium leguminosarum TaxID=384 RepID=UPI001C94E77D|nr:hypothetical protein [Rhizobium leguminosarum]MBY5639358.1 hypothetical protein [Rhizobium leguminosarum]